MAVDGTKPLTSWAEAETDRIGLRQDTQGLTLGCWIVLPMFRAGLCKHPHKHTRLCGLLISKILFDQTKLMITQLSIIPFMVHGYYSSQQISSYPEPSSQSPSLGHNHMVRTVLISAAFTPALISQSVWYTVLCAVG